MVKLPRYKLNVGQRLRYRMSDEPAGQAQACGTHGWSRFAIDWDFHVVAHHADGYSRVVFSETRTQETGSAAGEPTIRTIDCDGFFDIADDGRLIENWTITPLANPTIIFPQLPRDQFQVSSDWHTTLNLDGTNRHFMPASVDAAVDQPIWQFVENCQTQLDPIYLASRRRDYAFDLERGLVSRVTTAFEHGWPASPNPIASTDSIDLIEVIEPTGVDLGSVADEADRYFEVCAEYQRLTELALWDLPQAPHWHGKAIDVLERFDSTVGVEFIHELLQRKLKLHKRECGSMLTEAEKFAGLIDKPACTWRSTDLIGNMHSSEDYRGMTVVLIFWNRGCAWCIRALLALRSLASEMQGRPIAFLGVSADRKVEDAAFVWQTLKIAFPTILDIDGGHTLSSACGIDGYPTTVVIDQDGIIRRIRVGYTPHLHTLLAGDLQRLSIGHTIAATTVRTIHRTRIEPTTS